MSALVEVRAADQPSHEIDVDVATLVLDVVNRKIKGLDYHVENSLTGGTLERTIEGASTLTLTVHDPKRVLLRSGMFAFAIDVRLDRLYFRLVQVSKDGDELTLTFEDREVAYLRQHKRARKASRGKVTRAQFALSLVREVKSGRKIKFVCPDLNKRQPIKGRTGITNKRQRRGDKARAAARQPGLHRDVSVTVGGKAASPEQKGNMQRALDVADSLNAGPKATLALVEACIVESRFTNPNGGDRDSRGILQVRDSTAQGMRLDNRDVEACCHAFLTRGFTGAGGAISLARKTSSTAGNIAQGVQGSGFPARYDQVRDEAGKIVAAYSGGGGGGDGSADVRTTATRLAYEFRRGTQDGKPEDSWTCLQRLAEEVGWRCFMSAGALYFIAEDTLIASKARLILSEDTPGVDQIDFDVDNGKVRSEVTITARASRWIAAPGAVVALRDTGPADGRWLVSSISRGLFDPTATITLHRPTRALPEPDDAGTRTKTVGGSGGGSGAAGTAPEGLGTYKGLSMAKWVIAACKHAEAQGVTVKPTSGYRSHATNVAAGRNYVSEHEGTKYPHGAVDFGGFHDAAAKQMKMEVVRATADFDWPLLAPKGFVDDGHCSGTGH